MKNNESFSKNLRNYIIRITPERVVGASGLAVLCAASALAFDPKSALGLEQWVGNLGLNVLASILHEGYSKFLNTSSKNDLNNLSQLAEHLSHSIRKQANLRIEIGTFLDNLDAFKIAEEIVKGDPAIHGWLLVKVYSDVTQYRADFDHIHQTLTEMNLILQGLLELSEHNFSRLLLNNLSQVEIRANKFNRSPFFAHAQVSEPFWADRVAELDSLSRSWQGNKVRVISLIGLGGIGKSSLVRRWFDTDIKNTFECDGFFWWSFYYQPSLDEFLESALSYLTDGTFHFSEMRSPWARIQTVISLLSQGRFIIVLDGLEVMQKSSDYGDKFGQLEDKAFQNFLQLLADPIQHNSFIVITSRYPVTDLQSLSSSSHKNIKIDYFSSQDGAKYLQMRGVQGSLKHLNNLAKEYGGHALSLQILAGYLIEFFQGNPNAANEIPTISSIEGNKTHQILSAYNKKISNTQKAFMKLLSAFRRPLSKKSLLVLLTSQYSNKHALLEELSKLDTFELETLFSNLVNRKLISREVDPNNAILFTTHPIIRSFFYLQLRNESNLENELNLILQQYSSNIQIPENLQKIEDLAPLFDVIYYSCRAGEYDTAITLYHDHMSLGHWELGFKFGAYEFQIAFLREFFPDRDLRKSPLVTKQKAVPFLYSELAYCFGKLGQPVEAIQFFSRAAEHSLEYSDYKSAAIAFQGLAGGKANVGHLQEALDLSNKAIHFAKLANAKLWQVNTLATFAWISYMIGNITKAREYYNLANSIRWSDNPEEWGLYSILGVQYATFLLSIGQFDESLANLQRNLKICIVRQWKESIAYCKKLLGDISFINQEYKQAQTYYNDAMRIARKFGVQDLIIQILVGNARIGILNRNYAESQAFLSIALKMSLESNYMLLQINVHNCRAELELEREDLNQAIIHAQFALKLSKKTASLWQQGEALYNLGKSFLLLNQKQKAKDYLLLALKIQKQIHDRKLPSTKILLDECSR